MTTAIKTKYVGGVFQPLEKIDVPEGEKVVIRLESSDRKDGAWLDIAAQDTADRIAALEADLPEDGVANWHEAMNRASKPARYVSQKGIVVE